MLDAVGGGDKKAVEGFTKTSGEGEVKRQHYQFRHSGKDRKRLEAVAAGRRGSLLQRGHQQGAAERLRVSSANLEEKVNYDTAALEVKNDSNSSALGAASHANTCVLDITNNESTQFLEITNRIVSDGQTDSEATQEAYPQLKQRHDGLKAECRPLATRQRPT